MANLIKYSTSYQPSVLRVGNYHIGTGDVPKGPTDVTDFWMGISPRQGGYTIYGDKGQNGPSIYAPETDAEMINITNLISGQNFTTVTQSTTWYFGQPNRMIFNRDYESIITDGLLVNLDAGFLPSYPGVGYKWKNIGNTISMTASLNNTPTYGYDYISFNDASLEYASLPDIGSLNQWSIEVWFRLTSNLSSKVTSIITNQFNGSVLNFSIGTNNAPTSYKLCVGFFNSGWHNTEGFVPNTGQWYQVVATYNGSRLTQYVDGDDIETLPVGVVSQSGGEIRMMSRWDDISTSSNFIDGDLAIVRIYNRELNLDEVKTNYDLVAPRFVPQEITNDNLQLYMDASLPISYSGTNQWIDLTDNGYIGSLNSGVTFSSNYDGYFDFDGIDDTISIPNNSTLQLSTSESRTFQVWVNIDSLPVSGFMPILGKLSSSYAFDGYYLAVNSDGTIRCVTNGASTAKTSNSSTTINTGTWYLITFITQITSTSASTKVYLNTTEIISNAHGNDTYNESNTFYLGYIGSGVSSQYLNGKIGSLYVYGKALSTAEINQNFQVTKTRYGL
jgi:hypothetical protein